MNTKTVTTFVVRRVPRVEHRIAENDPPCSPRSRTQADLAAIDPVVATVVSTEYIFQLGFMLVVPVLLVRHKPLAVLLARHKGIKLHQ